MAIADDPSLQQGDSPACKERLRIARPTGMKPVQFADDLRPHLHQLNLRIYVKQGSRRGVPGPCRNDVTECIDKMREPAFEHCEPGCAWMTSKPLEIFRTLRQGLVEIKSRHASSRAFADSGLVDRNDNGRTVIALDEA